MSSWRDLFNSDYMQRLGKIASLFRSEHTSSLQTALEIIGKSSISTPPVIIIGGIARSLYAPARVTNDIDLLLESEESVTLFKRHVPHENIRGRVHAVLIAHEEIELLSPSFLGIPDNIVQYVFATHRDTPFGFLVGVASPEAIILLKMLRLSDTDKKDIYDIVKSYPDLNLSDIEKNRPYSVEVSAFWNKCMTDNQKFLNDSGVQSTDSCV